MKAWSELSKMSVLRIQTLQLSRINYVLQHLVPFHPYYRKRYANQDLTIKTLADIEKLGYSSKLDILPTPENPTAARDFILQPNEKLIKEYLPKSELVGHLVRGIGRGGIKRQLSSIFKPLHIHFTTGRSSAQIPFFYSERDLQTLSVSGARMVETIGAPTDSIVVNAFPFAPHLAFWLAYYAARQAGYLSLNSGGGKILGTQKIIDGVERLKATILIAMPGYGYHLLREAVEQKKDFSSLRYIILGGEKITDGLRDKMKKMLAEVGAKQVKILGTYAFTEGKTAWVQCHEESGYHLYPDLELVELVDESGKPVGEGLAGEVTYTSLDWRGSIVLRYRTGDICEGLYYSTPCKYCGRTVPRLDKKINRKFDTVGMNLTKVKGELVNLATFAELISQVPSIVEWQVEITKKDNDQFEMDELFIHIALKPGANEQGIVSEVQKLIQGNMMLSPTIKVHPLAEIIMMLGLETELKEKRIIDLRKEVKRG